MTFPPDSTLRARMRLAGPAILLLLAGGWVYTPVWRGQWIWDDPAEISQNAVLRESFGGLARIWGGAVGVDYFPVKSTLQWAAWHLWGDQPAGYHLLNLGLHLLGAFLFWRLLVVLRRPATTGVEWLGALIFVVHPVVVESVAWISEMKNTLSLALLVGAMLAYAAFDERREAGEGRRGRAAYAASLLLFVLALLSKSTVVMFPAVLLLHAWWKRGRIGRRDLGASAPFFLAALVLGAVTVWFQHHRAIAGLSVGAGGVASRLAAAGLAMAFYFFQAIFPWDLSPVYPRWAVDPPSALQFLPWLVLAAVLAWLWRKRADWGRTALFGLGCFLLNLLPVLGFVPFAYQRLSWVADHFAYLPLLGLIGLAAAGAGALQMRLAPAKAWRVVAAGLVLALGLGLRSRAYARIFQDGETLWTYTVRQNPDAWVAHNNLGLEQAKRGDASAALGQFAEAVRLEPTEPEAQANLATSLATAGRLPEAIVHYREALRLEPIEADWHANLGLALARTGQWGKAIAEEEQALRWKPNFPEADNNLGNALARADRAAEAIPPFERAIALRPDYADAHYNLGIAFGNTGRLPEAAAQFAETLRLRPDYPNARASLGLALLNGGRLAEAEAQLGQALERNPADAAAQMYLGVLLAQARRWPEALVHDEAALRLRPDDADVHYNLGLALQALGRNDEAMIQFQQASRQPAGH